jgi:hypothetical protein
MVLMIAACGGDGEAATTTTSVQSTTTISQGTTAVPDTSEPAIADLTGRWDNDTLVLEVNGDGEYVVITSGDSPETLMGGFVARDGSEFNFVTGTTGSCPGQTGVYEATFTDDELTLTLVDDPCVDRASGFETPFSRATD